MLSKKGIVIDKGKDWAIILMHDGGYKKIKTSAHLEIGELYQEKANLTIKYVAAAVILLAVVLSTLDYFSVQAYAQVANLAELGVNRWGRVISVHTKNNDGQRILNSLELKNDKLELAVEKICTQSLKDEASSNTIHIPKLSVVTANKAKPELEDKILDKMDRGLQKAIKSHKNQVKHDRIEHDKIKERLNNSVSPQEEESPVVMPLHKNHEIQTPKLDPGIKKEVIKEKIKNVEQNIETEIDPTIINNADRTEPMKPTIPDTIDPSDPADRFNPHKIHSDLESDRTNGKGKIKQNRINNDNAQP